MKVDDVIRELKSLSHQKPLNGAALEKFKEYCRFLRSQGFGNQSIAQTTGYALPTIKEYTRGIKVTKTPAMAAIIELLSQMVDNNVTMDDVQRYLTMDKRLAQKGTSADKVATFMAELDEAKMDVSGAATLDSQIKSLRRNGISAEQILTLIQQLSQLGKMGISTENISAIADAAKKYGQADKVIQAINSYGGIADIQKKSAEKNAELSTIGKKIGDAKMQVLSLEAKKCEAQEDLDEYEKLKALGYNHETLREVVGASSKLGNPADVFRALKELSRLKGVEVAIKQMEQNKANVEADMKELQASHVHLQPVIKLCEELLYKHGFNIHAIEDLYKVAKKYGNPFEVLASLAKYEDAQALTSKITELRDQEAALQTRIPLLRKEEVELKERIEVQNKSLGSKLQSISSDLSQMRRIVIEEITETFGTVIEKTRESVEEYAKRRADAAVFEEELKMARIFSTITKYPTNVADLPIDYSLNMIVAVERFLAAKNVNPKTQAPLELRQIIPSPIPDLPLSGLLFWAQRAIEIARLQQQQQQQR